VANAVYHRGYDVREPIEVRISKEDIVILSYPGPDRSVNLAQLRAGKAMPRRYRNRRIGEFLKELEMTEGRSTGIPKIIRAMKKNGSPRPEFEFDDDHTYFLCRLPVHPKANMPAGLPGVSTIQVAPQVAPQVTPQVTKLLLVVHGEMDRSDLQKAMRLNARKNFRLLYLSPALALHVLEMTIPDKPNSRLQKYRLTDKGRALVQALKHADSKA